MPEPNPLPTPAPQQGGSRIPPGGGSAGEALVLSRDQVRDMIAASETLPGPRPKRNPALIAFLYSTACRVSEACLMQLDRVFLENPIGDTDLVGTCNIWRPKNKDWLNGQALGSSRARIILMLAAEGRLLQMARPSPLFLSNRGTFLNPRSVRFIIARAGKHAGIPRRLCTPHVLRRSRASHLGDRQAPDYTIQGMLGHKSIVTTQQYMQGLSRASVAAAAVESDL